MNRKRLLERFLRYVSIHTTAVEGLEQYPSCDGQWELGRMLVDELKSIGLTDVQQDEHAIVMATLPSNLDREAPTIAFNAHLDTSPETTGENVHPQVIESYQGGDIVLPNDTQQVIRVKENPELEKLVGATLITTDGTTLLGGDDKAGIAIIMELVETLSETPEVPHGEIRVLFTCDEEIGRGVDFVEIESVSATACYTFDGDGASKIDVETFSADVAEVKFVGANIHPSIAKGRMANSLRAVGHFLAQLPPELSPECTDGREGFIHPYVLTGGVAETSLRIILRDFDTAALTSQAETLREIATKTEAMTEGVDITVTTTKQYRNMGDGLAMEPRAVAYAKEAHDRLGREPTLSIIRGGTDGCLLTEKGLPTPNLSSGQHNPHCPIEWACLDEMVAAVEVGIEIAKRWAED